jgi:hypothetical protein
VLGNPQLLLDERRGRWLPKGKEEEEEEEEGG